MHPLRKEPLRFNMRNAAVCRSYRLHIITILLTIREKRPCWCLMNTGAGSEPPMTTVAHECNDFDSKLRPSNSIRFDFRPSNSIHFDFILPNSIRSDFRLRNSIQFYRCATWVSIFKLDLQLVPSDRFVTLRLQILRFCLQAFTPTFQTRFQTQVLHVSIGIPK